MVHAVKLWKLGFGQISEKRAERLHAAVEAGYFVGSLLFAWGTVYFFPVEGLEDFTTGCRFYEVGSVVFGVLTLYTELDRCQARRRADGERQVKLRELLEEFMYCVGSFVFLVGTFLFDPPVVAGLAKAFNVAESAIENAAAILFMVGSFLFSLGSYVNALSIFEAPKMFRATLISVTTCYQFGGLFFIAGTMGYVEAFEPNLTMKWVSTWFYMVGCFFYVAGSLLSFVSIVASHQVRWESLQEREAKRRKSMARIVGRAGSVIPRALKAAAQKRRHASRRPGEALSPGQDGEKHSGEVDLEKDADTNLAELAGAWDAVVDADRLDLNIAEPELAKQLAEVLGDEAGRELAAALRDGTGFLENDEEESDVFGAFWRSISNTPRCPPAQCAVAASAARSDATWNACSGKPGAEMPVPSIVESVQNGREESATRVPVRDTLSLLEHRDG